MTRLLHDALRGCSTEDEMPQRLPASPSPRVSGACVAWLVRAYRSPARCVVRYGVSEVQQVTTLEAAGVLARQPRRCAAPRPARWRSARDGCRQRGINSGVSAHGRRYDDRGAARDGARWVRCGRPGVPRGRHDPDRRGSRSGGAAAGSRRLRAHPAPRLRHAAANPMPAPCPDGARAVPGSRQP